MSENESLPSVPEVAAHKFFDYLNIHESPRPANVIFILGGSSTKPAEKAAELYQQGYAPKIAFISQGGRFGGESVWGMSEVDKYRQVLQELGIPEDAIIFPSDPQKQTRNTLAEARAVLPFLREHRLDPKSLILVSRPIHQRRAYLTFRKQHPKIEYINVPGDEPLNLNDPEEMKRLVQEAERLLDYGVRKSDIQKPDINIDIITAAAEVRRYLKATNQYQPRVKPSKAA